MNAPAAIAAFVTNHFDRWRDIIAGILERNGWYMSVDDVYKQCCSCEKLLFENGEAFAVVTVNEYPGDTRLNITLAGGTIEGLDRLDPVIVKFGLSIGASKATFIGRKGLARVMAKRGWKSPFVYMERELV